MDGESCSQIRGGDTMPLMYEVSMETLVPHAVDNNYVQMHFHTFCMSTGGE